MIITAILNMIVDPIFIYVFNWRIVETVYAKLLFSFITSIIIFYWIIIKKDA